ncbi:MAG TPA: SDR family oxidoreductase [Methylophilus sp.]|nr:SDR family oxidoreductase [Methylophilus sp.]HQQ33278.1 SDR family oxidoreductase [Methylophilus sp.]
MTKHTVLITGANRGLGLEFAKQYALDGWYVLACGRTPSLALRQLAEAHSDIELFDLDVGDFAAIDLLAARLHQQAIDVLICNAGVYPPSHFGTVDYDAWAHAFKVNCMATLKMAEAFAPHISRSQQRKLVTITSKMGSIDDNTSGSEYIYRTSKTALNMVMKSLSIDLKPYGIAVAALHPGWVRTDMGGPHGLIDPPQSVAGLRRVIANLELGNTGRFIAYDGKEIAW